jgi:LuxR family maltose regulon positive regulatory protein
MHTKTPAVNTAALYFTQRLTNALKAVAASPLTLVEAPMGYGKTVAVREYLRKRPLRVVWTSVYCAWEKAFWRDFCRALARAFPENTDIVESLARLGYPHDAVPAEEARELLLQLDFRPKTVLVFDDIHLLPESGPGGGLTGLSAALSRQDVAGLRLVLISRDTHTLGNDGRAALILKGRIAVIDREVFALNATEIREYFALCGLSVTPNQAEMLREATGGWIGALYLYLLRYSKDGTVFRPESSDLPDPVVALLEEEIFSLLPEASRELLLALSPLERFSREQAEFLDGGNNGVSAVLQDLQRKNSFIALDDAGGTYALHALFRRYLQRRFAELPEERRMAVHSRCADWFMRQNEAVPAIEACCNAGEYERALEILESDMSRNLVTEKPRFFVELFKACPEHILDRHMGAAFKYAIAAYTVGDRSTFGAQLHRLTKKCAALPPGKDADAWRGELEFLLSLAAYNDIAAMSVHHRKAGLLLNGPTRLFGPESPWTLGCPSVLFMFHRESGKLDEELALMDECLPHYHALTSCHGMGGEHQMRAEALYNRGDFSNAAVFCNLAEAAARAHGQVSIVLCCIFLRLRSALLEGRPAEATALVQDMRGVIRERRDFFLLHTVDLCEGHLHAFTGELQKVPGRLRFPEEGNRLYTFAGGYYYIVHGRILLLAGEYAAAAGLFTWLLQSGAFADNLLFVIYAHLYMAAANSALELKAEADAALRTALDLALPDKLYVPFVENADFLPLLKTLSRKEPYRNDVRQILRLAVTAGKVRTGAQTTSGILSLLTRRERQLVRHALDGKTYPTIAAELGLAPSTVKRAFVVIYKKLGVHSREQLAAKVNKN